MEGSGGAAVMGSSGWYFGKGAEGSSFLVSYHWNKISRFGV